MLLDIQSCQDPMSVSLYSFSRVYPLLFVVLQTHEVSALLMGANVVNWICINSRLPVGLRVVLPWGFLRDIGRVVAFPLCFHACTCSTYVSLRMFLTWCACS